MSCLIKFERKNLFCLLTACSFFPDRKGLRTIQRSLRSLTPEISDEDEDPYAVESLVFHGALGSGLFPYNQFYLYSLLFCYILFWKILLG